MVSRLRRVPENSGVVEVSSSSSALADYGISLVYEGCLLATILLQFVLVWICFQLLQKQFFDRGSA